MTNPTSTHAKGVQSPLTLIMKLKSAEDSAQLKAKLSHIQGLPPDQNPVWRALTALKSVHFARFVFLDDNTKLAVITTYDGTFDRYINEFIDTIGDIFNVILGHVDGAPPLPVQQHRQAFLDYVRANDFRAMEPFFSAYPQASVVDILAALENT